MQGAYPPYSIPPVFLHSGQQIQPEGGKLFEREGRRREYPAASLVLHHTSLFVVLHGTWMYGCRHTLEHVLLGENLIGWMQLLE